MDRRMSVTFDAADPRALGQFWIAALGYVEEPPPAPHTDWPAVFVAWGLPEEHWNDAYAIVDPDGAGPRVFIQKVPEGKSAKNRVHLDVGVPGVPAGERATAEQLTGHVAALQAAGAHLVREYDEGAEGRWVVLTDPEGNEFCVCA